jgi:Leucine-rich repeat (LRR) protein
MDNEVVIFSHSDESVELMLGASKITFDEVPEKDLGHLIDALIEDGCPNLTHLRMQSQHDIERLPDNLWKLTGLKSLSFKWCNLSEHRTLLQDLSKLPNLESLEVHHTKMSDLGSFYGSLRLKRLKLTLNDFCYNKFPDLSVFGETLEDVVIGYDHIPKITCSKPLPKLIRFEATGCVMAEIPAFLKECKNIEVIKLDDNLIHKVPAWLAGLEHLRVLDLENNWITKFTTKRGFLSLSKLNVSKNPIESIKFGLCLMPVLTEFIAEQTLLTKPSAQLISQGCTVRITNVHD